MQSSGVWIFKICLQAGPWSTPATRTTLVWPLEASGGRWGTIPAGAALQSADFHSRDTAALDSLSPPLFTLSSPGGRTSRLVCCWCHRNRGSQWNAPSDTALPAWKHSWEFMQLKGAVPNKHLSSPLHFEPWCWETPLCYGLKNLCRAVNLAIKHRTKAANLKVTQFCPYLNTALSSLAVHYWFSARGWGASLPLGLWSQYQAFMNNSHPLAMRKEIVLWSSFCFLFAKNTR